MSQQSKLGTAAKFYVAFLVMTLIVAMVAAGIAYAYRHDLPSIDDIYAVEPAVVTMIYDRQGRLLQKYHYEDRTPIPFDKIPPHTVQALLAAEDGGFYKHWGVEWRGVARALLRNVASGFGSAGGSTITQQLARMLFYDRELSLERKIKEGLTAIKIERTFSKDEILEMYLNTYYFGHGAYGIQTAARAYFNKNAEALTVEESALLAAILNAPARYSPISRPERALQRRNFVLRRMQTEGFLSQTICDSLIRLPIELDLNRDLPGDAPYFTEMVRQYLVEKYGEEQFYAGGLTVETTLDLDLQRVVEASLIAQLDSLQSRTERLRRLGHRDYSIPVYDSSGKIDHYVYKQIQGAFTAIDNRTGDILTVVGGKDFGQWKFNRAVQAKRQPGSAFKPFVYVTALDMGYHACDIMHDSPIVLTIPGSEPWSPKNFDSKFMGPMMLREGLARSRNLIAIKLLQKVGVENVIKTAQRMGIKSPLTPNAALAIGTSEVSLLEMVSTFSVLANSGVHIEPRFITRVTDRYGNVLEENRPGPRQTVLEPAIVYVTVDMMRSVLDTPYGTAAKARTMGFQRPAAGKTGTSDNFCDNWFIGFTPQITAGCWVGFDDKTSIGDNQTGAANALPVWTDFMIAAHQNLPIESFDQPPGVVRIKVCLDTGKKAGRFCPRSVEEVFLQRAPMDEPCTVHVDRFSL